MRTTVHFTTSKTEAETIEATINYFKQQSFTYESRKETILTFTRGSLFQNLYTVNPLNIKSKIQVQINGPEVKAEYLADSTFQLVTHEDEQLWKNFLANYEQAINHNLDYIPANKVLIKEAKKASYSYMKYAFIGAFIVVFPVLLISKLIGFKHDVLNIAMVAMGGMGLMWYKVKQAKKKAVL
jgi:hypothetical protein